MALKPSSPSNIWPEPAGSGAALQTIEAGFVKDAGDWVPSIVPPFTGALLDLTGTGDYVLTDVSAGFPAYAARLYVAQIGGNFVVYP